MIQLLVEFEDFGNRYLMFGKIGVFQLLQVSVCYTSSRLSLMCGCQNIHKPSAIPIL